VSIVSLGNNVLSLNSRLKIIIFQGIAIGIH
jgi:hypothetical protein